jgi:hypothetical protein
MATTIGQVNFDPERQAFINATLERINQNIAGKKAMATNAAAARGLSTSGVSSIPQTAYDVEGIRSAGDVYGQQAMGQLEQSITDRRRAEDFAKQKELISLQNDLSSAAMERLQKGQLIRGGVGAGVGLIANLLTKK